MTSPALQHRLRAMQAAVTPPAMTPPPHPEPVSVCAGDERWLAKMQVDRLALNAIRSRTRRNTKKGELLIEYQPYFSALIPRSRDPVLVQCLIWAADVGDWALALRLAQVALRVPLPAPAEFKRTLREVLLDVMSDQVLNAPALEYWERLADLAQVEQGDMSDRTRARFFKTWAQQYQDPYQALARAQQAQAYGAAVKTLIKQLQTKLNVLPNKDEL